MFTEIFDCAFQVLSLGAGFDTTYFKLSSNGKLQHTVYIEVIAWLV